MENITFIFPILIKTPDLKCTGNILVKSFQSSFFFFFFLSASFWCSDTIVLASGIDSTGGDAFTHSVSRS